MKKINLIFRIFLLVFTFQLFTPAYLYANESLNKQLIKAAWEGNLELVKKLISQGADVNARNKKGKTPYDVARGKVKEYLRQFINR